MNESPRYTEFFGFSQKPFDGEPDLDSLFLVKSQMEALISLIQGINERRGVILISGERGTGKTVLLSYLKTKLGKKVKTVFISRLSIFFKEIMKQVTQELGLPLKEETPAFFLSQLRTHLAEGLSRNENLVIFVDGAHNLNQENSEELVLLSQLQENGVRLVQIVLAGRPELEGILESEGLRPLLQQIQVRLEIQPLLPEESRLFIEQRLQKAGRSRAEVFTSEALDIIATQACGIFRNIIFLCDKCFEKGFELQQKVIDAGVIRKTLADMGVSPPEGEGKPREIAGPEAVIHRLFQNPPRIVKPGIFTEVLSYLKEHPRYLYISGTLVLASVFYLGWEFLLTSSPSQVSRIESPSPVAKESIAIPAAKEKVEIPPQIAPVAAPERKAEPAVPASEKKEPSLPPAKPKLEAKTPEKSPFKGVTKQPAKAELKKEPKAESKPEVPKEVHFNEPVEVPKGKTLYSFARDYYHHANPTLVDYILEFNPHIKDLERIPTDQKIVIPEIVEGTLLIQSPDGSWKIRLGTFESRQKEKTFKEEPLLKEKEIEIAARVVSPTITWYRFYAGKFATMDEAFRITQELRKKGLLPAFKKR